MSTSPKAAKAATKASAAASGTVLKRAFPKLDADGLKLVRRHLRKALRTDGSFKFHKIGSRWVFPSVRDVKRAQEVAKPYLQ